MSGHQGKRVSRTYTQHLVSSADEVFPLICPVREKEWLADWDCEMIYSESGLAEQGAVFTTQHAGRPETIWTIIRHDREAGVVEFWRVTPGVTADQLTVQLESAGDGRSLAHITYTFTTLSAHGDMFLEHHQTEQAFVKMVTWWEKSLNHFLETGEMLRGHPPH